MRTLRRAAVGTLLGVVAALAPAAAPASAATAYTVPYGEALSSLAASNGLTADQLASWNGLSAYSYIAAGQTIYIPVPSEVGVSTTSTASTSTATTSTAGSHTVVTGETLSSIAAANGVSADSLAAANGLLLTSIIYSGQTLAIPAASTSTATGSTATSSSASASGLAPIYCPCGTDYLNSSAAAQWDAMRQDSIATYGVDIYPNGPLSAYRTYDQQAYLYNLYLSGQGAPANPPGTSPHEYGNSVDLASPEMRNIVDSIGGQFGWGKIYGPTEWWHVDYLGG